MPPLELSEVGVRDLLGIANSRVLPHSLVHHAHIVLACGAGETNTTVAKRMGVIGMTVGKWRKRYRESGIESPHVANGFREAVELRPIRPRTDKDVRLSELINSALQTKSSDGSTRGLPAPSPPKPGSQKAQFIAGQKKHLCSSSIARKLNAARKTSVYKISADPFACLRQAQPTASVMFRRSETSLAIL